MKHLHGCHGAIDQFDEVAVSRAAHQKPRFIEWRRHKRSIIIEPVFVRTSWCEMRGCMTNLSARGAAIEITGGSMPAQGEDIALILQDKMYLWGTTLRVDQGIVAMQFPSGFEEIGDVLSIELRGIDIYRNSWR